ncbi:MAG: hypothetical protein ACFFDP_06635 [Promethearchaeota archaeon]
METEVELSEEEAMKKFLRKHTKMALAIIGVIVVAAIVAVFTFLKVAADAQILGLVPTTLGLWSVGICYGFVITVLIWELIFVVSWLIPILVVTFGYWYRKLPKEERKEYGLSPKRGADPRRTEGGGVFSFFVAVVWLIIVWITNRWDLAFQSWTFNDWIYSWLTACLWILIPLVIAGTIYFIWWIRKDTKTES